MKIFGNTLRKKACKYCGDKVKNGGTRSTTGRMFHPYWHEIEWTDCTTCGKKIWLGNCYKSEPFPDVEWYGWGDGSFEEKNIRCERCF